MNTIVGCTIVFNFLLLAIMEKIDKALAVVLRKQRERKKISQEDLAFLANVHRTYISQLERGLKSITLKTLIKITDALEIDIIEFIKEVNNELETV